MENDKLALMKRLNMVLVELDRGTQEKAEVNAKLMDQTRLTEELQRKLEQSGHLKSVLNRNLQEDLRYERDLNEKLREELKRFEFEKSRLLQKV